MIKSLISNKVILKEKLVPVPELEKDGEVIVREMAGIRLSDYIDAVNTTSDPRIKTVHMIIGCCVDESGTKINSHDQAQIIYDSLPSEVINRLAEAANEVNSRDTRNVRAKKKS
ncbi:TPA: hypothetical protein ACX6NV_000593 [Photobacterium damselae]